MIWADTRDALAELYEDEASIRRIAADALLSLRLIDLEGNPSNQWQAVMKAANDRGRMLALIKIASREYPDNIDLRVARAVLESGGTLREEPSTSDDRGQEMAFDDRDQRELENLRKNQHSTNNTLQEHIYAQGIEAVRLDGWKKEIERQIAEVKSDLKELRDSAQTYISTRWMLYALIVFLIVLILGIWYLQSGPIIPIAPTRVG